MGKKIVLLLVLAVGFLSSGAVLKKKDAIQDTQTDPTAYQAKLKEQMEGKKGPPAPTLELFPKQRFLSEGPVEKPKSSSMIESGEEESPTQPWIEEGSEKDEEAKQWEWQDIKEEDEKDDTGGNRQGLS